TTTRRPGPAGYAGGASSCKHHIITANDAVVLIQPVGQHLAALPRAAIVVEDRYSQVFTQQRVRPALVADSLAELQVRWPNVPIVYAETRPLAEEWTYRYLAAAHTWAAAEDTAVTRIGPVVTDLDRAPAAPGPSTAEIRAWAREHGHTVPDRGRLRPEIIDAWHTAHPPAPATDPLLP
uniref:Lsr2 family DNA-binding protein n=1 Tax=Actinoplanes subtropicus TaxID=543632 RepID=UPI001B80085D